MTRLAAVGTAAALALGSMLANPAQAVVTKAGAGDATFINYPAPEGIAEDAGEPTLGVNWNSGRTLFQAFLETDQVTFDDTVFPATATWKDVSRPPTNLVSIDPILHTDEITGRTLVSQLAPPCSIAAFTDSDGEPTALNPNGYAPSAACGAGSNLDHQTVHFGRNVSTPTLYGPNRLAYYCSQVVVQSSCSVSFDGGITFPKSRPTYTFKGDNFGDALIVGCEGLHGHLNTSPVDGTAYLPNFGCNNPQDLQTNRPAVVVSPDEGTSWTIRQVPDAISANFDSDPAVDVDTANRAYVAYEDVDSNLRVATTTDRGVTWTGSQDLGAPFGIKNSVFPAVIAGSDGRAAVAFLGTPAEAPANDAGKPENQLFAFDPDGNAPNAGWHAYISLTYDGGENWTTQDITPTDPVQRGCVWWDGAEDAGDAAVCESNKRNLLDFNDVAVDKFGRVQFAYADGCINRCVNEGHTRQSNTAFRDRSGEDAALTRQEFDELYSQEDTGVIARQSCGMGLFAEFDNDPAGPLARCAAAGGGGTEGPGPVIPEIPFVPALLLAGAAAGGGLIWVRRRKDTPAL